MSQYFRRGTLAKHDEAIFFTGMLSIEELPGIVVIEHRLCFRKIYPVLGKI